MTFSLLPAAGKDQAGGSEVSFFLCGENFRRQWSEKISQGFGLLSPLSRGRLVDDPEDAELLVANETDDSLKHFFSVARPRHFRLLLAMEAIFPDFNSFDWAISFVPEDFQGRNFRPHPHLTFVRGFGLGNMAFDLEDQRGRKSWKERNPCDFIYSNPQAHSFRDSFFLDLSEKLKIDSLGRHLNSGNFQFSTGKALRSNWIETLIDAKSNYRFSISIENASFSGYTSEKLLSSFAAGSIPIYWGNPLIAEEFNMRRFLNLHDYLNLSEAIDHICHITNSEREWLDIVKEPVYTPIQEKLILKNEQELKEFFAQMFEDIESSHARRGLGYWPTIAEKRAKAFLKSSTVVARFKRKILTAVRRSARFQRWFWTVSDMVFKTKQRKNKMS